MKNYLLAVATIATFSFLNSTAFAACADEIPIQASRMTTRDHIPNDNIESLKSAFALLQEAKTLCDQGNESGAAGLLAQVDKLLTGIGR